MQWSFLSESHQEKVPFILNVEQLSSCLSEISKETKLEKNKFLRKVSSLNDTDQNLFPVSHL